MTTDTRFERDLPAILEDLYLGPAPDYRTRPSRPRAHAAAPRVGLRRKVAPHG